MLIAQPMPTHREFNARRLSRGLPKAMATALVVALSSPCGCACTSEDGCAHPPTAGGSGAVSPTADATLAQSPDSGLPSAGGSAAAPWSGSGGAYPVAAGSNAPPLYDASRPTSRPSDASRADAGAASEVDSGDGTYAADGDGNAWAMGIAGAAVYDMAVDSEGNIVLAGDTRGPVKLGPDATLPASANRWFVAKLDANGHYLWGHALPDDGPYGSYGVSGSYGVHAIAVTPEDDIVLAGAVEGQAAILGDTLPEATERDTVLTKLDPDGHPLWNRLFEGTGLRYCNAVAVSQAGDIFVAGGSNAPRQTEEGLRPSIGKDHGFLTKAAPDGSHVFTLLFDTALDQEVQDVAIAANGDVLITGRFEGHIDLGGGELTARGFDTRNLFVARYDSDGNHLHSQRIASTAYLPTSHIAPTPGNAVPTAVPTAPDAAVDGAGSDAAVDGAIDGDVGGGAVICGSYRGELDLGDTTYDTRDHSTRRSDDGYLATIDPRGNLLHSRRFGGERLDWCNDVTTDSQGDVFATGRFWGLLNLGGDDLGDPNKYSLFYSRYDTHGAHLHSRAFVTENTANAMAIGLLPSGHVVIAGYASRDGLDLGFTALHSADGFVVAIPPPPL